ncbi:hypothetical protein [Paraburkholderia sp. J41]|uniref:hypothetical protein n=1 Tax=Paraburkholderia sp. J41 TaxID=2805433 RepID=UPI002AC355B5|nr:hypothetical protein [Paraburkholderia sp. J41]
MPGVIVPGVIVFAVIVFAAIVAAVPAALTAPAIAMRLQRLLRLNACGFARAATRSASVGIGNGGRGARTVALPLVTRANTLCRGNPRQERLVHRQTLPKVTKSLNSL